MPRIDRAAIGLALALPLFLLHGRGIAEALVILIGALFLIQSAKHRDWSWLQRSWVRLALAWCAWVVLCSVPHGAGATGQAIAAARFILLVAALEHWVLREAWARLWLARMLRWSALYLAAQSMLQFATGRNLFGWPRGVDGELTGPYKNPRAGAPLSRLLLPAVLPTIDRLVHRGPRGHLLAWLLLPIAVAVVVLIGQRMPLLLTVMGLFVTALFMHHLRRVLLASCGMALFLLAATSVVSPPTFYRLVTKFSAQMEHFPDSDYGRIAARAVRIAESSPVLGAGFDGFRRECPAPAYFRGWTGGDGGGADMCVQHPHNIYLQALVEAGIPGLLLFMALVGTWLRQLFRGLIHKPEPLRVGLFTAALIHLWPIASSTAFTSMPLAGWFFVLLGLGLAEVPPHMTPNRVPDDAKEA